MLSARSLHHALGALGLAGILLAPAGPAEAGRRATDVARDYVRQNLRQLGLTAGDVGEIALSSVVASRHNGLTHVYFEQRYRGIPVNAAILNVNVTADGRVVGAGNRFVANVAAGAGAQAARTAPWQAAEAAARHLNLAPKRAFEVLRRRGGPADAATLSDGGIASRPLEASLVWLPTAGTVRLCWKVEIEESGGRHLWNAFVDAETGAPLFQEDLVTQDSAEAIAAAIVRSPASPAVVAPAPLPAFPPTDGASYRVFALPFESPNDGDRTLETNSADPAASPFGWHDTDGIAGAEFTITRGNNVHAYTDIDANNVPDPGSSPDGGAGLFFDFPLDLALDPSTYRPAAVTNLFYWNNVMHDVSYGFGFDEAAGNFQVKNYTGAVGGGDDVRAEGQDGSGTNNANFGTPAQNAANPRPRMQMFIWTHPRPNVVHVGSGPAAGDYEASGAAFGPRFTATGPITAGVALVDDGVEGVPVPPAPPGTVNDGCEPFGGVAGKIALLDRGFCTFVIKVKNAQNAGAVAVIVANNVAGNPTTLGGTDPTITIPSVMVSLDTGALLKVNLPLDATVQADPARSINRDSDIDAGVIAHEYGHGISNRLTGGPNVVNCLQNAEQMGEGWSDWQALTLTTRPSDTAAVPRGIGPYVVFEPADGPGIRPTPYSPDMAIDPATYDSIKDVVNISQPHGIGYVWNTMLWDMYWNLVDRHGYNPSVYDSWTTAGNNLAMQLVTDGMKIQPCSPGFVDGRNAIVTADQVLTAGANQCEIWRAFARRGLGFGASQGSSNNRLDGVEAFDLPASCTAAVFGGFRPPVDGPPAVNVVNAGSTVPVKFTLAGQTASLVIDTQAVDCETLLPTGGTPLVLATASSPDLKKKGDSFHFNWRTSAAWEGSCRRLTLRIAAPADAFAYFRFH